jgi:hypothetical protein
MTEHHEIRSFPCFTRSGGSGGGGGGPVRGAITATTYNCTPIQPLQG